MKKQLVLAHGILGFGDVKPFGIEITNYFRGLKAAINDQHLDIITTEVSPVASIQIRAKNLVEQIEAQAKGNEYYILAHSMGGLDVRQALYDFPEFRKKVKTIVTIGTPHKGSEVADVVTGKNLQKKLKTIIPTLPNAGIIEKILPPNLAGVIDLRTDKCVDFNSQIKEDYEEMKNSKFFTIAGRPQMPGGNFSLIFKAAAALGGILGVDNDGVVTVDSATYNEKPWTKKDDWPVDHAGLIGWFESSIWDFFTKKQKKNHTAHIERYINLISDITKISKSDLIKKVS